MSKVFLTLVAQQRCFFNGTDNYITQSVFPWIAAIFIKNEIHEHFDYVCDGAILSERVILTAARCVSSYNKTIEANNLIVLLGKRSLQTVGAEEKAVKIKKVIIHENYTNEDETYNDLAILIIEDTVLFNNVIQPACVRTENETVDFYGRDITQIATTGWSITGDLTSIPFDVEKSKSCNDVGKEEYKVCANYGNDVTVCPSYGGLFVTKHADDVWYLSGIRTGDPAQRGFCTNTGVLYTIVYQTNIVDWIHNYI